jgi:hypothetical protein
MAEGDYRDELAAAHARIAELERQLAEVREGGTSRAAPWLAELDAKRAATTAEGRKGLGDPKRRWRVTGILVGTAMAMVLLSVVFASWFPFIPLGILALHPGLLLVWSLGHSRTKRAKAELAKIDEKIADVKRMAAMMGDARVRIDTRERVANAADADTGAVTEREEERARRA